VVTTVAGLAAKRGATNGVGSAARFSLPRGVAVDAAGNLYVTDDGNSTVRKGVPFAVTNLPQSQAVLAGTNVTLSVGAAGTGPYFYQWLFNGALLPGQTNTALDLGPLWGTNSGAYSLNVRNATGNAVRLDALVVAVTNLLQDMALPAGTNAILSIGVAGPGP